MGKHNFIAVLSILILALATVVTAEDLDDPADGERIVIVGDDDERIVLSLDGGELTVISEDGDGSSVHIVDMEQIGVLVGDALSDLDGHLAILEDLQLDLHMGTDNRLNVSWDDDTFEVDVNEIMVQVSEVLAAGLADFRIEDWSSVHARDDSDAELRRELRELKAEMRDLRRQIRERDSDED